LVAVLDGDRQVYAASEERPRQSYSNDVEWDHDSSLEVDGRCVGSLVASFAAQIRTEAEAALHLLNWTLTWVLERGMESRSLAQETLERYREINLLYTIHETIGASLDAEKIPGLIIEEASRVIQADSGIVLLDESDAGPRSRSGFGPEPMQDALRGTARSKLDFGSSDDISHIWAADQLGSSKTDLGSVLVSPLAGSEHVLGFVMLGRKSSGEVFSADEEKLLSAITSQAAIAMENARLFSNVRDQRDAMAEMTTFMDNIFTSIASGVITTDIEGNTITMINRAAEDMLGVREPDVLGGSLGDVLPAVAPSLGALIDCVKTEGEDLVDYELTFELPGRSKVVLRVSLSPLRDKRSIITGTTIVIDDLTEQRKLAARARRIRRTFEQYVAPRVVERLLSDPDTARLGGTRREVTTLFADIRGFTTFGERQPPETLVEVLNRYLSLAADVILSEEGTLDKYFGDGVMAVFNAPLSQPDHTLRAVRAALAIREAVLEMHPQLPEPHRLQFGIGITSGMSVIGSIGSNRMKNYTAIGDCVNLASRLQRSASHGEILLGGEAYQKVAPHVEGRDLGIVEIRGHIEPIRVFRVCGLVEDEGCCETRSSSHVA
jgi:PAS domain S-box-containing protein